MGCTESTSQEQRRKSSSGNMGFGGKRRRHHLAVVAGQAAGGAPDDDGSECCGSGSESDATNCYHTGNPLEMPGRMEEEPQANRADRTRVARLPQLSLPAIPEDETSNEPDEFPLGREVTRMTNSGSRHGSGTGSSSDPRQASTTSGASVSSTDMAIRMTLASQLREMQDQLDADESASGSGVFSAAGGRWRAKVSPKTQVSHTFSSGWDTGIVSHLAQPSGTGTRVFEPPHHSTGLTSSSLEEHNFVLQMQHNVNKRNQATGQFDSESA